MQLHSHFHHLQGSKGNQGLFCLLLLNGPKVTVKVEFLFIQEQRAVGGSRALGTKTMTVGSTQEENNRITHSSNGMFEITI